MTAPRILIYLPCCIGDVVMATAALAALRRTQPQAHITWAISAWSRPALEQHPLLDALIDAGAGALPVKGLRGLAQTVQLLRAGHYDQLISFVRSPWMSAAAVLSGIPVRAGLNSGGRGFGYTHRVWVDPEQPRHEAALYLAVVERLGVSIDGAEASIPVQPSALGVALRHGLKSPYLVVNPTGGRNPGMTMDLKRYPLDRLAALTERLSTVLGVQVAILAGPHDEDIVQGFRQHLHVPAVELRGVLSFAEIGALAAESKLYLGNDTGLTHYAAAVGAPTVMILGPTDPRRYAPFTRRSLALWSPTAVSTSGVAGGLPSTFDWLRDGISVEQAYQQVIAWRKTLDH